MSNITINGKSLEAYLEGEADKEKKSEIKEVLAEDRKRPIYHGCILDSLHQAQGPRVAKRCRHLTPQEIRKEKGIMSMPYNTQIENLIWLLLNKGPITAEDLQKELKSNNPPYSQLMTLERVLPDVFKDMPHETHPRKKLYLVDEPFRAMSVEALYAKYKSPKIGDSKEYLSGPVTPTTDMLARLRELFESSTLKVKVDINVTFKIDR